MYAHHVRRRFAPVVLATGVSAVAAAAVVVQWSAGDSPIASHLIVDVVVGVVSVVLGSFLIARIPANPMGWLFALSGAAYAAAAAVTAWVAGARTWSWPALDVTAWASEWVWVLALGPQLTYLLLLFPDGDPPTPRWRVVGWLSGAVIASLTVALMFAPEVQISATESVPNPFGGSVAISNLVGPLLLLLGLSGVASLASLLVRLARSGLAERHRIAPYVAAAVVAIIALVVSGRLPAYEPLIQTLTLPLLPVAATMCVLRYRLYDLEVVVRRSLVWLGLTAMVVVGYGLVVSAVSNALRRQAGLPESLLAAGVVAALFQPSRVWLQATVGRLLYGHRDDRTALLELGRAFQSAADPSASLTSAAQRIGEALAVPWVVIEVLRSDTEQRVAQAGSRPTWADEAHLTQLALIHSGTPQGTLKVCRRSPHEPLSSRDVELLERIAYPIAATAAAFRLTDDLQVSRERIVVAREEERRLLRHDLHDELGPLLAAISVQLEAARLRSMKLGDGNGPLLDSLRSTTRDAIGSVRRIVEHLRPPALDELGLVGAVDASVAALSSAQGPVISIYASLTLPPLGAALEVAAYRIAVEAVTNAVRHARAERIAVNFAVEAGSLVVTITDDGIGIDPESKPGVGVASMRDRAEELGGELTITDRGESGTLVRAHLPMGDS